ncbi:hypothetical protein T10_3422 [Trichinella papuae]|uniref:Uncharacterized protein n=1 Tax=Trichinella papuae TaxID=268474 RepID=A0A0V1MW41_9BILA|nr:hypothetical protein T10_3422 [Trichinella papuae]
MQVIRYDAQKLKHLIKVRNSKHPFVASLAQPYRISTHKKSYMPLVFFSSASCRPWIFVRHRYSDRYLHNGALRGLERFENLLIAHFNFAICFPMCALLLLLLDMQEQLQEQESY